MSDIEWTEKTWNPMVGCTPVVTRDEHGKRVPAGCDHCYAEGQLHRFGSPKCDDKGEIVQLSRYDREGTIKLGNVDRDPHALTFVPRDPVTGKSLGKGAKWTGVVWLLPGVLDEPLRRKKPTTYFVNSLSDVFHESVVGCEAGRRFIAAMFGVMAATPWHTYQILTKRPEQARRWFAWVVDEPFVDPVDFCVGEVEDRCQEALDRATMSKDGTVCVVKAPAWPLPNVWMLTSISTQPDADQRIPELLAIPAALHGVSAEPLLGPIDLGEWIKSNRWCSECLRPVDQDSERARLESHHRKCSRPDTVTVTHGDAEAAAVCRGVRPSGASRLTWAIAGGESGPKARPCEIEWLRSLVGQCRDAGVAAFVKQLGSRPVFAPGAAPDILNDAKGGDMAAWPADLRVREMPR